MVSLPLVPLVRQRTLCAAARPGPHRDGWPLAYRNYPRQLTTPLSEPRTVS
jgi:hypothetical protein